MTDEAKRMVEWLREESCNSCVFSRLGDCQSFDDCLERKAADLIESLSAEMERVKRERDEAWKVVKFVSEQNEVMADVMERVKCERDALQAEIDDFNRNKWQWRGVKED